MYGFDTDEITIEGKGLPVGFQKLMAVKEDFISKENKPENPNALVVTWEVVEGEHKGRQGDVYYNINHANPQTARIAKETIKKIAIATGAAINERNKIKGRVLVADIREQVKNPQYTEIKAYHPADFPIPESEIPF